MENQIRYEEDNNQTPIAFSKEDYAKKSVSIEHDKFKHHQETNRQELHRYYWRYSTKKNYFKIPLLGKCIIGSQSLVLLAALVLFIFTLIPYGKHLIQNYSIVIY
jgi:hypothetical protein